MLEADTGGFDHMLKAAMGLVPFIYYFHLCKAEC